MPWQTSEIKLQTTSEIVLNDLQLNLVQTIIGMHTTSLEIKQRMYCIKRKLMTTKGNLKMLDVDDPKKSWKTVNKILNREKKSSNINCIPKTTKFLVLMSWLNVSTIISLILAQRSLTVLLLLF